MMKTLYCYFALYLLHLAILCDGLGCINQICESNAGNSILNANCSVHKQHCGSYGGKRFDNALFNGLDIGCATNSALRSPFAGTVSFFRPRGGQNGSQCIDSGLKIDGQGQWSGYAVTIAYLQPVIFSGNVKAEDLLGYALDFSCTKNIDANLEPHIVLQLLYRGKIIDPTYRVASCMCTGQICTSNLANSFIDKPFKHKPNYGKGYELHCGNTRKADEVEEKVPDILSPIEANFLGRFRPWNLTTNGAYACENDGVFLVGSGKWSDFVVHIYNVKFVVEPGDKIISQGEVIAKRLSCADRTFDSVFVEFRHKGRLVNVTNLISATDCRLPQL